jgi:threonine aldolase
MSELDYQFASDNAAGVCPEAWEALAEANRGFAPSYGADVSTARARQRIAEIFETDCEVHFVFNGTASNALALGTLARSHESVLCHEMAHVDTDECGAPEFFSGGSKLLPLPGPRGKLTPDVVSAALQRGHGILYPKPGTLTLTQATEWGTLYQLREIEALSEVARSRGMRVHMDGARFANAAAAFALQGVSPAAFTWKAGVEVLSFGGTKNGMLTTEAVVFFKKELARDFIYRVKQGGQLAAKQRFAGAQWDAMLKDGAWLRHAAHANRCAQLLADGVRSSARAQVLVEPEVNAVFLRLGASHAETLQQSRAFYRFIGEDGYRFMCSWATSELGVKKLIADLA